jgi:alpha-glucosidase
MTMRLGALLLLLVSAAAALAQPSRRYEAQSPDRQTQLRVDVGDQVSYTVIRHGRPLVEPSPISLSLGDGRVLGRAARVIGDDTRQVSDTLRPVAPTKSALVKDRFTALRLRFAGGYGLELRAYDDGVAYRWVLDLPEDTVTVLSEEASFHVAGRAEGIVGLDSSFMTHYEPGYRRVPLDYLQAPRMGLLPLLVIVDSGPKVAITESGLEDYPGMYLVSGGAGTTTLVGTFPQVALEEQARNDRDVVVTRRASYIARTAGKRALPWRIVILADADRELLENQLVYVLAPPSRLSDVSWIKPGKVSWDWWNALNVRGVPFRAGVNNDTYKYYIDFAARFNIPYIILDEGWYKLGNLLAQAPGIDVPELVRYGRARNVGVILWMTSKTLNDQMTPAMDQFQRWGVKGLKVDFMHRDDQGMVNFYWRTAREAAARKLLLDFHGAHKPAGLNRAYPNVLTFEGVRGLEQSKWSTYNTPEHNVTLPFTRMLAGPMDYTPGAMLNAQPRDFRPIFEHPMSQGTRAHQLAMYVVYESPLQMLADSPSEYLREPESMQFLSAVPTVWDETRALAGQVGGYALIARRRGADWYVGAMNNGTARTLTLDLSFLGAGRFTMDSWSDGINADRNGMDYRRETKAVAHGDRTELKLAPGGGFAARIRPTRGGAR